jgi:hypothetical protein
MLLDFALSSTLSVLSSENERTGAAKMADEYLAACGRDPDPVTCTSPLYE